MAAYLSNIDNWTGHLWQTTVFVWGPLDSRLGIVMFMLVDTIISCIQFSLVILDIIGGVTRKGLKFKQIKFSPFNTQFYHNVCMVVV